jgi:methyl-accepting chemotaxis protein
MAALRVAVAESQTPTALSDKDGIIVYVNDAMRRMHQRHADKLRKMIPGFHPDRVVGSSMDGFHRNPAHQRAILRDPSRLPYTGRIHAEGLNFELVAHYVADEEGAHLGNVLEWFDRTEEMLLDNEKRATDEVIDRLMARVEFTPDGRILTANGLFLQTVGYTLEEIKGQHHRMFMPQEAQGSAEYVAFWNRLSGGEAVHGRFIRQGKGGRQIALMAEYFPVKDNEGKVVKVIKLAKDITEQVRQEDLVTRLRASIDGANAYLMYCNEKGEVFHINPAMRSLVGRYGAEMRSTFAGFDPEALMGRSIDWLVRGDYGLRERFASPVAMPIDFEVSFGGRIMQVHVTMIRGDKGEYLGNRVEFIDLTEQREIEQQVEEVIQAAARGEFDRRIDVSHFQGFLRSLGEGINTLMDNISRPIYEVLASMSLLADGDLTRTMEGNYQGDFAQLQQSFNLAVQNLRQMTSEIRAAADSISTASREISLGNQDLARRTEQQASSLETTASSMEEITGTVKNNAENSARADKLAGQARKQAVEGREIAGRAIGAMSAINQASNKIADIIGVIDEIAFQTNLLALNAAVEAARAGEQGRGFAVVAAEVRNLAQRSASAAKEIKGLIKDSLEKVADGSRLVDESGKMLDVINQIVAEVGELISQIAAAGKEQAIGIEQINKALVKLDEMTQQNAALVEEAATASSSLDEQAQNLQELVRYFRVEEAPAGLSVRKASHAPAASAAPSRAARPAGRGALRNPGTDESDWEQF